MDFLAKRREESILIEENLHNLVSFDATFSQLSHFELNL